MSKRPGLVAGGVTYGYPEIWADHQSLVSAYPGALLLKSENYTNFSEKGFWVTVAGQSYATAAAANAWCDSKSIGPGDCFATRLTHTGGPAGNTVSR